MNLMNVYHPPPPYFFLYLRIGITFYLSFCGFSFPFPYMVVVDDRVCQGISIYNLLLPKDSALHLVYYPGLTLDYPYLRLLNVYLPPPSSLQTPLIIILT